MYNMMRMRFLVLLCHVAVPITIKIELGIVRQRKLIGTAPAEGELDLREALIS